MQGAALSVVIPAFNEAGYLPDTLGHLARAMAEFDSSGRGEVEVLVVDNASTDATAEVAEKLGATVVDQPVPGIGLTRNTGAVRATAPVILFLDADTQVPADTLVELARTLEDPDCIGGAFATDYRPKKRLLRPYMAFWRWFAGRFNMTQGIAQFCTAEAFAEVGGYDVDRRMAEDTHFYWALRRLARRRGKRLHVITEVLVVPSCRRIDQWPVWKTILMTNPIVTRMRPNSDRLWKGWRKDSPR